MAYRSQLRPRHRLNRDLLVTSSHVAMEVVWLFRLPQPVGAHPQELIPLGLRQQLLVEAEPHQAHLVHGFRSAFKGQRHDLSYDSDIALLEDTTDLLALLGKLMKQQDEIHPTK